MLDEMRVGQWRIHENASRADNPFRDSRAAHVHSASSHRSTRILGGQAVRAGTSVGAHCREGYRSRSDAELISKLEVALQEMDETMYWFDLLVESGTVQRKRLEPLMKEADEIIAIMVASVRTIKRRKK
ncbi:MAG TPA: four helix bundle protein [Thermoanaerobaculia bacterium]|nr:four helix bundle protein [Thermoanaerobaculia bacterium]